MRKQIIITNIALLFVFLFTSCGNKSNDEYSYEYEEYYEDYYPDDETLIEDDYIEISYQEKNGVKLLPVSINGLGFYMIFDTGCSTNLISSLEFASLVKNGLITAHLQSSVFKLSKDLIDSIHEEGIVAYTS